MTTNMENHPPSPPLEIAVNKLHSDFYDELETILGNKNSRRLSNSELVDYFEKHKLLENEKCMEYICSKNELFNKIYTDHYKNNKKDFELMTRLESMCQCWLMYLYH